MMVASAEQRAVIEAYADGNVIVDAVAGAGKTTTCLHIAAAFPDDDILLLTYNRALMDATAKRARELGLTNLTVRTIHSFAMAHYGRGRNDDDIQQIVDAVDNDVLRRAPDFSRIIIDESQDIKGVLHAFICQALNDNESEASLCVLGDALQMIYGFRGADARFLTMADRIYPANTLATPIWTRLRLSTSFRVHSANAAFINNCMLREPRIVASQTSDLKPAYLVCNGHSKKVFMYISDILSRHGVNPENVMIIAPSVKPPTSTDMRKWSPVNRLIHWITEHNIGVRAAVAAGAAADTREWPIARQDDDDHKCSADVLAGKILVSTIHGVKGCERPYVFVFGFDASYFEHFDRAADPDKCPNLLYVAATRASRELVLIHEKSHGFLPFLDVTRLREFADVIGTCTAPERPRAATTRSRSVTAMTKFIPEEVLAACRAQLIVTVVTPADMRLTLPSEEKQPHGTIEQLADITGTLLPAAYQLLTQARIDHRRRRDTAMPWIEHLWAVRNRKWFKEHIAFLREVRANPAALGDLPTLARLCTLFKAYETDAPHRAHQITDYNWVTPAMRDAAMARMSALGISAAAQYECELTNSDLCMTGYADCVDAGAGVSAGVGVGVGAGVGADVGAGVGATVYEFKCVGELTTAHMIQLALYALMYQTTTGTATRNLLFNIITGELLEVAAPLDALQKIATLVRAERKDVVIDDVAFLARYGTTR